MSRTFKQVDRQPGLGRREFIAAAMAALLSGLASPALSQPQRRQRQQLRRLRRRALQRFRRRGAELQDRARAAVLRGDVRPLRDVIAKLRRRSKAELLDVDLHETDRGWVYALRILTLQGRVRDVFLNARSLEVLQFGEAGPDQDIPLPPNLKPSLRGRPPRSNVPRPEPRPNRPGQRPLSPQPRRPRQVLPKRPRHQRP